MTVPIPDNRRIRILNGSELHRIMARVLEREDKIDQDREHFWVVGLNVDHVLLFIELISLGSMDRTIVEPTEVFSTALQKRAKQIILVHNHPAGTMQPSDADREITDRLIQVGMIVELPVYDHLIISTSDFMSFRETGLFKELEKSTRYVPAYMQVERSRRELERAAEQKRKKSLDRVRKQAERQQRKAVSEAERAAKVRLAGKLKQRGDSYEDIAEVTGLTVNEVATLYGDPADVPEAGQ